MVDRSPRISLAVHGAAPGVRWRRWAVELLVVVTLTPVLAAIVISFSDDPASTYGRWWAAARGWRIMAHSAAFAGFGAAIATVAAWCVAAAVAHWSTRRQTIVSLVCCVPLLLPSALMATGWIMAFGRQGAVAALGVPIDRLGLTIYAWPVAAAAVGLRYFGIAVLILTCESRRQRLAWPAEQVFRLPLGARLLKLRLAASAKALVVAWLLVALFTVNDHVMSGMFLVNTYTTQLLIESTAMLNPAGAVALAMPMMVAGAAVGLAALQVGPTVLTTDAVAPPPDRRRAPVTAALRACAALPVIVVAVLVPIGAVVSRCGSFDAIVESFAATKAELWHTLWLALVGGALCAVLAAVLAGHWLECRRNRRFTAVPLVLFNLLAPASLLGLGIIELGRCPPLGFVRDSSWPLVAGYVARFAPLATLVCFVAWRRESRLAEHAAVVHGCSSWRTFLRVTWPGRFPVVLWAAVLCAMLIGTELDLSVLLVSPGTTTLGVRLYTLIHTAPDAMVSAAATNVVLLVIPATALWAGFSFGRLWRRGDATP